MQVSTYTPLGKWLARGCCGLVLVSLAFNTQAQTPSVGVEVEVEETTAHPTPYAERADVAVYRAKLVAEHGFDDAHLQLLFARAQQRQDIIERISRPAEKVWTWGRYKKILVGEERIAQGVAFWQTHAQTLQRAAATYGVAPQYVVAILGIESQYGATQGSFPVLDTLFTLGFDYPPRMDFFRAELTQFLLLTREEQKDPQALLGSYAGAMGYGQFISSSYRHYAVDFDDDGIRDIWQNPVDAIGSVANYFAQHQWRDELQPVAVQVSVADPAQATGLVTNGLKLGHTVAQIRAAGVTLPSELDDEAVAALYQMQGLAGEEYWLALHNFYVITRYNRSRLYALAVVHLADGITAGYQTAAGVGR